MHACMVFEKEEKELVLKKIYVEEGENEDEAISAVVQNMGWSPKIPEKLLRLEKPEPEEILLLRCFDPNRYFLGQI